MGVVYAENESHSRPELRRKILTTARTDDPPKPWNLVDSVAESPDYAEEDIRTALKEMMLEGELETTATGEVRATTSPA